MTQSNDANKCTLCGWPMYVHFLLGGWRQCRRIVEQEIKDKHKGKR